MTWVKGLHIISIVFWSASLIYLPILMAEHSPRLSDRGYLRLHGMVRDVYLWIASPFAILAIISGTVLIPMFDVTAPWFALKLLVVALLAGIHARCGVILAKQSHSAERANALVRGMRIALPVILFPCVLWLVLAKPSVPFSRAALPDFLSEPPRFGQPGSDTVTVPDLLGGQSTELPSGLNDSRARSEITLPLRPPVLQTPVFRPATPQPTPVTNPTSTGPDPRDKWRLQDRANA